MWALNPYFSGFNCERVSAFVWWNWNKMQILPPITRCNQLKMNARLAIELQNYIFVADALESCFLYSRILPVWFGWVISRCDFKRNWNVFFLFARSLRWIWFVALNCIWLLLISHNFKVLLHISTHCYLTTVVVGRILQQKEWKKWERNE